MAVFSITNDTLDEIGVVAQLALSERVDLNYFRWDLNYRVHRTWKRCKILEESDTFHRLGKKLDRGMVLGMVQ